MPKLPLSQHISVGPLPPAEQYAGADLSCPIYRDESARASKRAGKCPQPLRYLCVAALFFRRLRRMSRPGYHRFHERRSHAMPPPRPAAPSSHAPESASAPSAINTREFAHNMLSVAVKSQKLVLDVITRMSRRERRAPIDPLTISRALLAMSQ